MSTLGETDPFLKMVLYGNYGTGKTVLAASSEDSPEMREVLFVDCEAGTLSIRKRKNLHRFPVTEYRHVNDLVGYLRSKDLTDKYRTVIIDSITEIAKQVIRQCIVEGRNANPNHDRDIAEQRDWQRYTERMRVIIRAMRDAPVNVIMTALERENKDDATGAITVGPMVQGQQVAVDLGAYVDIVGRMTAINKGAGRKILLQPDGKYAAKDRSGLLPPEIENPTMSDIMGRLVSLTRGA